MAENSEFPGLLHLEKIINDFEKLWGNSRPFVKLFKNDYGYYLYDPGTSKSLECEELEFKLLEKFSALGVHDAAREFIAENGEDQFIKSAGVILEAIETEKILLAKPEKYYFYSKHFTELKELCETSLSHVILETTESCNLRCEYCIFSPLIAESRPHGSNHMELSTAYAAIDYLSAHSTGLQDVHVGFYGGEPLLRFPFIKECVEYSKKIFHSKNVHFTITTNGTLITPGIADYVFRNGFSMIVSIDGPQDIHDSYRVDTEGKGTFERAMNGTKILADTYGDAASQRMSLSMVYAPPYHEGKLDCIANLWNEYPWLKGVASMITYPHPGSIPPEKVEDKLDLSEQKTILDWLHENYLDDYINKKESSPFVKDSIVRGLIKIARRFISPTPVYELYLNGCCLPAVRKIYVDTRGDIYLCEKIHQTAPSLGSVKTGIDYERMKKIFVDEYSDKSIPHCSQCWANKLCGVCYNDAYTGQKFDAGKKADRCRSVLYSIEKGLNLYSKLLKIDPGGLNYFADIEIS